MAEEALPGSRAVAASQLRLGKLASHIATNDAYGVTGRRHVGSGRDSSCGSAYRNTVSTAARGASALPESDTYCTDAEAEAIMKPLIEGMQAYYARRGIFQGRFGFGKRPAVIVIDFAYKCVELDAPFLQVSRLLTKHRCCNSWTDENYAGGTSRMDEPVRKTAELLAAARSKGVPIIYTTSPDPEGPGAQLGQLKTADRPEPGEFKKVDSFAMTIDARVAPSPDDLIIEKTTAGAFFGTPLISHLIALRVDTVLLAGCREYPPLLHLHRSASSDSVRPLLLRLGRDECMRACYCDGGEDLSTQACTGRGVRRRSQCCGARVLEGRYSGPFWRRDTAHRDARVPTRAIAVKIVTAYWQQREFNVCKAAQRDPLFKTRVSCCAAVYAGEDSFS